MNIEIMRLKNTLAELKKKHKELDLKASTFLNSVRIELNPYEDDITELDLEKARNSFNELVNTVNSMKETKSKIKKLKKELGDE